MKSFPFQLLSSLSDKLLQNPKNMTHIFYFHLLFAKIEEDCYVKGCGLCNGNERTAPQSFKRD
jgi:hypothetical protein